MRLKNPAVTTGGAAALALTLTFALGGCSTGGNQPAQGGYSTPSATSTAGSGSNAGSADAVTAIDAVGIAVDHQAGDVVELEADDHRDTPVWEVTVRTADGSGVELYIDRASGDVINETSTRISDDQRETPQLSITDAIEAVLQAEPGTLTHIELERDRGAAVWEAEVRTAAGAEAEITLDATTGDVVKHEID